MNILDKAGKFIISNFYDKGLERFEMLAKNQLKSPSTDKLRENLKELSKEDLDKLKALIENILTSATHDFLFAIQENNSNENDIKILVDNKNIADVSDGLQGELFTEDGWIKKFSNNRYLNK